MKLSDHARRLENLSFQLERLSGAGGGLRFERYGGYISLKRIWPGSITTAEFSESINDEKVLEAVVGLLNDSTRRAQLHAAVLKMIQEDIKDTKTAMVQSLVS